MRGIKVIVLLLLLMLFSCEKATDFYLGIYQQPEFTEDNFEEGMNIFGLLRPDFNEDYNRSFVYIEEVVRALSESDFKQLTDVDVTVYLIDNQLITDTFEFPLMAPDTLFTDTLYRSQEYFVPIPGSSYRLVCEHDRLPTAIGELTFPAPPVIAANSFSRSGTSISFSLEPDPLIKLIDVYFSSDEKRGILGRFVPSDSLALDISLNLESGLTNSRLIIYAYDGNLANYYANSNTSLNFNKYRTTISTLESGFGVFGALNYLLLDLE